MKQKIDLTGKQYGRLNVLCEVKGAKDSRGYAIRMWKCMCQCGNVVVLPTGRITSGNTSSCGCYKREYVGRKSTSHGLSKTKLYRVWNSIKERCYKPYSTGYTNYGGRGVVMCEQWLNDFATFYEWAISSGYKHGLTIERKDVNGNYCPENCCWIPKSEQAKNRRNCHFIKYKGETKTLSEWCRELHIDRSTVRLYENRFHDGEKAIDTVLNSKRHKSNCQRKQLAEQLKEFE